MSDLDGRSVRAAGGSSRLVPMRTMTGYRLAEDEPDIRGWEVRERDGRRLGTVQDLLVDSVSGEVGALAVSSGRDVVVVPMSVALIDGRSRTVVAAPGTQPFEILPERPVDVEPEVAGVDEAQRSASARARERAVESGYPGATIERTADGEEIIRIPVVEEELVVERRAVVKEVIVIRKRATTEQRVIEADLRRERVEVDRPDVDAR